MRLERLIFMAAGTPLEEELDERQLIARVLAGDSRAERELYDIHVERVYRFTYRLTGDAAMTEECVQETFIKVFTRLQDFRGQSALTSWIHAIALSVVRTGFRKVARMRGREAELTEVVNARAEGPRSDVALRHRLHTAIDGLPDEMRTVFVMHDIEGYKHHEIAETMDAPVGTIKSRLSRARAALRQVLDPPETKGQER